jgi:hypothetical protein
MTLILAITGRKSIWMLADRRLVVGGRPVKEDARKIMFLDTSDGLAILGYAGLGATPRGTEPADWMARVLRGRNVPLEQALGFVADAMKDQFRQHVQSFPRQFSHIVVVPSFVGGKPRLYSIGWSPSQDRRMAKYHYTRHVIDLAVRATPRLAVDGSGGAYLYRRGKFDVAWRRQLLKLVNAHDAGRIKAPTVADQLARLNLEVHRGIGNPTVGPRCIVAWRDCNGGGGQQFYDGTQIDRRSSAPLPRIVRGTDLVALLKIAIRHLEAMRTGRPLDEGEVNAQLALLPDTPDEVLR